MREKKLEVQKGKRYLHLADGSCINVGILLLANPEAGWYFYVLCAKLSSGADIC